MPLRAEIHLSGDIARPSSNVVLLVLIGPVLALRRDDRREHAL